MFWVVWITKVAIVADKGQGLAPCGQFLRRAYTPCLGIAWVPKATRLRQFAALYSKVGNLLAKARVVLMLSLFYCAPELIVWRKAVRLALPGLLTHGLASVLIQIKRD